MTKTRRLPPVDANFVNKIKIGAVENGVSIKRFTEYLGTCDDLEQEFKNIKWKKNRKNESFYSI